MIEKVNPCHPDKVADRIAGAIVDLAYSKNDNPKIAVEVLIGHGTCTIITETSELIAQSEVRAVVDRIAGEGLKIHYYPNQQDAHLAANQADHVRCGDNGIFKGCPVTDEQQTLSAIARDIFAHYPTDGKYILSDGRLIICQSHAKTSDLRQTYPHADINPLGDWTGGPDVDTGATNRKLGSDMADGVTGGGLHGKDLSKADVSVNIWCHLEAQQCKTEVQACCAIGDTELTAYVGGEQVHVPYGSIVAAARNYIESVGGFEKFAEWGLV
jgi:S-adenosylmethionine synthetase